MTAPAGPVTLRASRLRIPFRSRFAHASAVRGETQTVWVEASRGGVTGVGEGCPREYVTGESLDSAEAFVATHRAAWEGALTSAGALRAWVRAHAADIDANPSAWCAVETALLDLFGRETGRSLEAVAGLPPTTGRFHYTAVLGDGDEATFAAGVARYRQAGFEDFKVKLRGNLAADRPKVARLAESGVAMARVRVDANNLWRDPIAAAAHLNALDAPVFGIEEPVAARRFDQMRRIAALTGSRIILDESVTQARDLDAVAADPSRWIVNVRVSKMGGVLRALDVVRRARAIGLPVIVGAQVGETSVLTRAALPVAAAAGAMLVGQEGAFGTWLLARDVCDPPLMFGPGGVLDADAPGLGGRPGLGFDVRQPAGARA